MSLFGLYDSAFVSKVETYSQRFKSNQLPCKRVASPGWRSAIVTQVLFSTCLHFTSLPDVWTGRLLNHYQPRPKLGLYIFPFSYNNRRYRQWRFRLNINRLSFREPTYIQTVQTQSAYMEACLKPRVTNRRLPLRSFYAMLALRLIAWCLNWLFLLFGNPTRTFLEPFIPL